MSSSRLRFVSCFSMLALLVGCGGSSKSSSSGGGGGQSNPTTVTYDFTAGAAPLALAAQIGTGSYNSQTLVSGKLTLTIPSGETKFAVAYACPSDYGFGNDPAIYNEYISGSTISDGTSYYAYCYGPGSTSIQYDQETLKIDPSAFPLGNSVVFYDESFPWTSGVLSAQEQLPTGTYDIPVSVSTVNGVNSTLLAVKILRSQTVPGTLNSGATVTLSRSDAPSIQTASFSNLPSGFTLGAIGAGFDTASDAFVDMSLPGSKSQFLIMPSGVQQSGDYYTINGYAYSQDTGEEVGVQTVTTSSGPQSLSLPAAWSYTGPTAAKLPTFDFVYPGFAGMSNVTPSAYISWQLLPTNNSISINSIFMTASANYQGQSTSMTIPDLSGISGFLTPPASGTSIDWGAEIFQGLPTITPPPSGTQYVENGGTYVEP